MALFLVVPKFFNYEKKINIFKNYILKHYNLKIINHDEINFNIFPKPNLVINNVELELKQISSKIFVDKFIFYPKLLSIYNYENFQIKKLILDKNEINLQTEELSVLISNFLNIKNLFLIKNLDIKLSNKDNLLINLNKINFSNYGFNKNIFFGTVFDKIFKFEFNEDLSSLKINIPDIDFQIFLKFSSLKKDYILGNSKIKFLNTNLKFNFSFINRTLDIFDSFFRSKHLSFSNKSILIFNPYFESNSNFTIENIDLHKLKELNFKRLFDSKNIIQKINSSNEINLNSKKIGGVLVNKFKIKIDLAYGRLNFQKTFKIDKSDFSCKGSINLFEELSVLDFNCSVSSINKKDFLKIFSVKYKDKKRLFELNVRGNINISDNKINFKSITTDNYKASNEDLKYFKSQFEKILYDQSFLNIFELKKIKKFILEIS